MIRAKSLRTGFCIVDENGIVYVFDKMGRFEKTDELSGSYINGILNLPIISILSSGDYTELCVYNADNRLKRYSTSDKISQLAMKCQMESGLIKVLTRNGIEGGVRYNQYILVYNNNTDVNSIVKKLNVKEA